MERSLITFQNVQKIYRNRSIALREATFEVKQGEFVFVTGNSGSGKSTLLKLLHKVEKPTSGSIFISNVNIARIGTKHLRRNIGFIFQDFRLLPKKTAYENVAYVLECIGKNPFKIPKMTMEALEQLGIADKSKSYPNELSGGQQQRVAIARAIVNKPLIMLCDEPTADLDDTNTSLIMKYLKALNATGTTIMMATHDTRIVESMDKRILYIENGRVEVRNSKEFLFDLTTFRHAQTNENIKESMD